MTATFCRHFYWSDYNLWPEHLPQHTLVSLCGGDRLCPAEGIRQWLTDETDAQVLWEPHLRHAHVLIMPGYQRRVLRHWVVMAAEGERSAAWRLRSGAAAAAVVEEEEVVVAGAGAGAKAAAAPVVVAEAIGSDSSSSSSSSSVQGVEEEAEDGDASAHLVDALLLRLRREQARVAEREAANLATAQHLRSLAKTVGRRHTTLGHTYSGGSSSSSGSGDEGDDAGGLLAAGSLRRFGSRRLLSTAASAQQPPAAASSLKLAGAFSLRQRVGAGAAAAAGGRGALEVAGGGLGGAYRASIDLGALGGGYEWLSVAQ